MGERTRETSLLSRARARHGWPQGTMTSVTSTVQYWLRASLPGPPGQANGDKQRGTIYRAALPQFEELLQAAAATGYAARPLPLFYALSQAGRAIVASHGDEQAKTHGLTVRDEDIHTDDPLETLISPTNNAGWFHAVAKAGRSPGLAGPVSLGALIASLPELSGELLRRHTLPRALFIAPLPGPEPTPISMDGSRWFPVGLVIRPDEGDSPEAVDRLMENYPAVTRAGYRLPSRPGGQPRIEWAVTAGDDPTTPVLPHPPPLPPPLAAFQP